MSIYKIRYRINADVKIEADSQEEAIKIFRGTKGVIDYCDKIKNVSSEFQPSRRKITSVSKVFG